MAQKINFDFQCGACLVKTTIKCKRVTRWRPVTITKGICKDCESTNHLRIEKLTDGMVCQTIQVDLTWKGQQAYYTLNPDKDPENVQQNGTENHQPSKQEPKDDTAADSTQDLQGEVTKPAT